MEFIKKRDLKSMIKDTNVSGACELKSQIVTAKSAFDQKSIMRLFAEFKIDPESMVKITPGSTFDADLINYKGDIPKC